MRIAPGDGSITYSDVLWRGPLGANVWLNGAAVFCECHAPAWAQGSNGIFCLGLLAALSALTLEGERGREGDSILRAPPFSLITPAPCGALSRAPWSMQPGKCYVRPVG